MKKIVSLILAVASTLFLFVGATQAAEHFDAIGKSKSTTISDAVMEGPTLPCGVPDEN